MVPCNDHLILTAVSKMLSSLFMLEFWASGQCYGSRKQWSCCVTCVLFNFRSLCNRSTSNTMIVSRRWCRWWKKQFLTPCCVARDKKKSYWTLGSLCNRMASVSAAQWAHFKRPWTALQYYTIQEQATTRHAAQTGTKFRILFKNTFFNSCIC